MNIQSHLPYDNTSLPNFIAWAQGISIQLSALGLVQSADTGQVNWGTIASVPTSGSYVYEIWEGADALQGACPIFLKIEYGNQSGTPSIATTMGTGSDGAGNLTGNVGTRKFSTSGSSNQGATTFECNFYGQGDGSSFAMMMWRDASAGSQILFGFERSRDNAGAMTALYFTWMMGWYSTNNFQQSVFAPGSGFGTVSLLDSPVTMRGAGGVTSWAVGTNIPVFPFFPMVGWIGNPMTIFLCGKSSDVVEGVTITTGSPYGGSHTYLESKANYPFQYVGDTNYGSTALLIRWE